MEERERGKCWGRRASIAVFWLAPVVASAGGDWSNVRLVHVVEKATIARALDGAARRLARPDCQALLDEFKGVSGQPLRAALEASGVDAPEYLARVYFYDAPPRLCGTSVLAVTTPGSRAVLMCGSRFVLFERSARHAEAVLIHEALHSLGLGENPPSSDAITERVLARCGQR